MVLMLDHGVEDLTRSPPSMHSFFQPITQHDPAAQFHQQLNAPILSSPMSYRKISRTALGFDGADDNENIDPYVPEVGRSVDALNMYEDGFGQGDHRRTNGFTGGSQPEVIELSEDRRKRRKITPDNDGTPKQDRSAPQLARMTAGIIPWARPPGVLQIAVPDRGANIQPLLLASSSGTKPPQAKRGRPKSKVTKTDDTQHQQTQINSLSMSHSGDNEESRGTEVKQSPGTPDNISSTPKKKRNISNHANGTLLSSPRASPKRLRQKKVSDVKTLTGHNIKMRNGKLVQSLPVQISYAQSASRLQLSAQIDAILSSPADLTKNAHVEPTAKTHPFFLGKSMGKMDPAISKSVVEETNRDTDNEPDESRKAEAPVAWKDIKFSGSRPVAFKSVENLQVIWPPRDFQHIGHEHSTLSRSRSHPIKTVLKSKAKATQIAEDENVLRIYNGKLIKNDGTCKRASGVTKRVMSGNEAVNIIDRDAAIVEEHMATSNMRSKIYSGTSAFDRGQASEQSIWPSRYAPSTIHEVLQPSCDILHDWLKSLAIHNIKTSLDQTDQTQKLGRSKKKRLARARGELDDFVQDDDEDEQQGKTLTAILITGPSGCGKTAAVYAVAKQLGFEVFEIHPGMRRSAKDVFEKVGDMMQNHLVQRGNDVSNANIAAAETTITYENSDSSLNPTVEIGQRPMSNFFGMKAFGPKAQLKKADGSTTKKEQKEQKQSLILFEEVDILFEDDRGFWTGVQTLIHNSKRPVILTCNDLSNIPLDELDLHAILTFAAPESRVATEYMAYLAASEGHIINRTALSTLYASKGYDMRAAITELNFWCQMTIGSRYGGLDWMLQSSTGKFPANSAGERLRTFSQDTYRVGLDLLPEATNNREQGIIYLQEQLNFDVLDWYSCIDVLGSSNSGDKLTDLQDLADLMDARSCLAIFDASIAPILAASIFEKQNLDITNNRSALSKFYIKQQQNKQSSLTDYIDAFEPLMEEKPTFPPSLGRLAPSLDFPSSTVAYDIAPYVRAIVSFDSRLEQHRDEMSGSQGKTSRTTRAARAALEGGDKARTRSERWFPKMLDFERVRATGGSWPEWYEGQDFPLPMLMSTPPSSSTVVHRSQE